MQIRRQESRLEVQLSFHKQGLYVPMHQRSIEFRCRFTPMESDPSKENPSEATSQNVRYMPAHANTSVV